MKEELYNFLGCFYEPRGSTLRSSGINLFFYGRSTGHWRGEREERGLMENLEL